jgi:hypothetical protein
VGLPVGGLLARSGVAVDISVVLAMVTAMAVFYLEGFGFGVFWSALGLFIQGMSPYSSHIQRFRQRKAILNRYEFNRRPLGI